MIELVLRFYFSGTFLSGSEISLKEGGEKRA